MAPPPPRTCDNCRKRKIKCVEDPIEPEKRPCEGCSKLALDCTHDYVKKKPGRKNTFAMAMRASQDGNGVKSESDSWPLKGGLASKGLGSTSTGMGKPSSIGKMPTKITAHQNYMPYDYSVPPASASTSNNHNRPGPSRPNSYSQQNQSKTSHYSEPSIAPSNLFASPNTHRSSLDFQTPALPNHALLPGNFASSSTSSGNGTPSNPRPMSSFAFSPGVFKNDNGLSWLDSIIDNNGWGGSSSMTNTESNDNTETSTWNWGSMIGDGADPMYLGEGFGSTNMLNQFPSEQAHLLSLESPEHLLAMSTGSAGSTTLTPPSYGGTIRASTSRKPRAVGRSSSATRREPQLEDVTSWANISHFISLFLQYLYPLLPLVHRPTFAENLATRRDLTDTDFRALLLSIVAYVISQLPTSRLINDQFDIEGLKHLQRRCHRTCKILQRTYYGPTNLVQVTTIIFDCFYLLSIGLGHTAASRLGQAIQLAFSMGMHSDEKTMGLGLDAIEVQLRRRVFWQLYASDKTRAIPGPPMLINDFQGVPSLPEPVDDEFITSQGFFPQPAGRTSVLAGFVAISNTFKIISDCFFHHRCILSNLRFISTDWTSEAEERLHKILRDMPLVIQDPSSAGEGARQVFGMQRANVLITSAIAKFALYDLRAALNVDEEQLSRERETIAREIHSLLMNIPVEDLASNGESVRGKVFHIACALCVSGGTSADSDLVRDWCNMFSAISFVQMPPPPPEAALDSRAGTPPEAGETPLPLAMTQIAQGLDSNQAESIGGSMPTGRST